MLGCVVSIGVAATPSITGLAPSERGVERLDADRHAAQVDHVDLLVGEELLRAGRALFLGRGDEAGDQLDRVAVHAAELGVGVLDRHLRARGGQQADGRRAALLVDEADVDRRQGRVRRAGLAADVGQVVGHRLGALAAGAGAGRDGAGRADRGRGRRCGGCGAVELELELLLQPTAASSAAATAAKPILLSLRTVVPPGVGRSCRLISPERRGSTGFAGHGPGGRPAGGRSRRLGGRASGPHPRPPTTAVPRAGSGFHQAGQAVAPWPSPVASRNLDELPQERPGVQYPSTIW